MKIKMLSYNIHKGVHFLNRKPSLDKIKEIVQGSQSDLVFLQEIRGQLDKKGGATGKLNSQFEYLADSVWTHYAYGRNAIYSNGDHGNAILSKYPIKNWRNIDISNHSLERRGMLHVELALPDVEKNLHLICLHLDLSNWGRQRQIKKISQIIRTEIPQDEPLIVAGDFNDWRIQVHAAMTKKLLLREAFCELQGNCAKTFPSWMPVFPLDRVYSRGFKAIEAEVLREPVFGRLSDHAALLVDLQLE